MNSKGWKYVARVPPPPPPYDGIKKKSRTERWLAAPLQALPARRQTRRRRRHLCIACRRPERDRSIDEPSRPGRAERNDARASVPARPPARPPSVIAGCAAGWTPWAPAACRPRTSRRRRPAGAASSRRRRMSWRRSRSSIELELAR